MANKLYQESAIQDIAVAIREKNGSSATYKVGDMGKAVRAIKTGDTSTEPLAEYQQQNPIVTEYLEEVSYSPLDYSVSNVLSYSYKSTDYTKSYPTGYDINLSKSGKLHLADKLSVIEKEASAGVNTLVNSVPNEVAHWWNTVDGTTKQNGTIKPLGQVRMIKTTASNVRDLGGWACDGGIIKYEKLFRGGELSASDIDVLVKQCGIRHDLDLRGKSDNGGLTSSPLGNEVYYTITDNYVWYSLSNTADWITILQTIFKAVKRNEPLIFHCAAGADRTGTVACIVEAILGVSQPNIDKDFELTTFAVHPNARRRTDTDWQNLIGEISASYGSSFRNKVINWVGSLGFTADEINDFRKAVISGTPENVVIEEAPASRLPAAYQECEWVQIINGESHDINSCVRTNVAWNSANKIVTKVQNLKSSNVNDMFFAAWNSTTEKDTPYIATRTSKANYLLGAQSGLTNYSVTPNNIASTDLNANEFTLNFTASSTADICFGGWNDNTYSHPHKWYKVEIYNGNNLLSNFVPCYRKADDRNGFYDLVGEAFYENAAPVSGSSNPESLYFLNRGEDVFISA